LLNGLLRHFIATEIQALNRSIGLYRFKDELPTALPEIVPLEIEVQKRAIVCQATGEHLCTELVNRVIL